MSDDLRDEFARSYPSGQIVAPPAHDLWGRGRRQRRRRMAMQAFGAAASIVVLAGVGAVYALPAVMTPDPAPQIGSDGIQDEELRAEQGAAQLAAAVEAYESDSFGYLTPESDAHGIATDLELTETTCRWLADEVAARPNQPTDLVVSRVVTETTGVPLDSLGLAVQVACQLEGQGPLDQGRVPPFADQTQAEPEPDGCDHPEGSYEQERCESRAEHDPREASTEDERDASEGERGEAAAYPDTTFGAPLPDRWSPSEDPPTDLTGLSISDPSAPWYVNPDTGSRLVGRAGLEERLGAEPVAELCGWLERETERANAASDGGDVIVAQVSRVLLERAGVSGSGGALAPAVAGACWE